VKETRKEHGWVAVAHTHMQVQNAIYFTSYESKRKSPYQKKEGMGTHPQEVQGK
jgi:hypothetical protein